LSCRFGFDRSSARLYWHNTDHVRFAAGKRYYHVGCGGRRYGYGYLMHVAYGKRGVGNGRRNGNRNAFYLNDGFFFVILSRKQGNTCDYRQNTENIYCFHNKIFHDIYF